jgi:hypothetical protein
MISLIWCHGEVQYGIINRVVQPTTGAEVSLVPVVGARVRRSRDTDVCEKTELPAQQLEKGLQLGVVGEMKL